MPGSRAQAIEDSLRHARAALEQAGNDRNFVAAIAAIAERMADAFRNGRKVLIAGNGGSAADAQHIAAELVGRFGAERSPLPAIALTTDTSALTAIGNDYGFEHVFERQLRALGQKGDLFLAISTSGNSPNIVAALKAARAAQIVTIGFCGTADNAMRPLCDLVLACPGEKTALAPSSAAIQQVYMTAAHIVCGLVEQTLFPPAR